MFEFDPPQLACFLEDSTQFYQRVKTIYAESGYDKEYPLNFFWGGDNMRQLCSIIQAANSASEKISAIHDTFMFSVNTDDETIKNRMIDWYLEYFNSIGAPLDCLDLSIQESPFSNPRNAVRRNERLLAPDFLRTVLLCLEIKNHCQFAGPKFKSLELGAGYGGLARTLRLFFPQICQVIVDIPETLFFSSLFLRLNFPQAKVCFVSDPSHLVQPLDQFDFVFVPTKFVEGLKGASFELFCNTASLGEMKNSVIRHWMDFVQNQVDVRYFFGLNRFLNTIDPVAHSWRLDENVCSVSFDARWRMLKWELEPGFTRCPYLETIVTRNLEVIAERLPLSAVNPAYHRYLSEEIARSLAKEDWFLHAAEDNSMLRRDNIICHDLSRRGTLFKLWESIRLCPRAENVRMMIVYLRGLQRERPFEETFYYQGLLNELAPSLPGAVHLSKEPAKMASRSGLGRLNMPSGSNPELVRSGLTGYNIVRFQDEFFALAQALGQVDVSSLTREEITRLQKGHSLFIAASIKDAIEAIQNHVQQRSVTVTALFKTQAPKAVLHS